MFSKYFIARVKFSTFDIKYFFVVKTLGAPGKSFVAGVFFHPEE
jgi:hypothetical protein